MWSRKYAVGVCEELYVPPQSTWEFFNALNRPRANDEMRKYAHEELVEAAANGDMVLVFNYKTMRSELLTKELISAQPAAEAR